ncbi:MAG: FliM/FliN family flagellar motor switch protein [Pseudomonadota bacterium]
MTDFSPALHRFGDVAVRLSVELGRADMPLRDVLSLGQGSVVALNRMTDELLDITANGKVIAQGEVVAQDGKFALKIVTLVGEEPQAPAMTMPAAPAATVNPASSAASVAPATAPAPTPSAPAEPQASPEAPQDRPEVATPAAAEPASDAVPEAASDMAPEPAPEAVSEEPPTESPAQEIDDLADALAEIAPTVEGDETSEDPA